ncbi:MAG: glycosyltransferase family 39 protein [Nitrospirota bacterium]
MKTPDFIFPRKYIYVLILSWLAFLSLILLKNQRPLKLISIEAAYLPSDLLASLLKLGSGIKELGLLVLLILAAIGAGRLILSSFRASSGNLQMAVFSLAIGLGALSYLTFFLGIIGEYNSAGRVVCRGAIILMALFGLYFILKAARRTALPGRGGILRSILVLSLILIGVFIFAKALVPATFYDAVAYHLSAPKWYILEGGIKYNPYDTFSNFPFTEEMLYTLGMLVSGLKLAQLISVTVFLACVLAVYSFSRDFIKEINPALPALIFLVTPAFIENSVIYTNDLMLVYYTLMTVYAFFVWEDRRDTRYLVLSGVFAGLCLGTKYVALASIAAPAAAAVFFTAFRRDDGGILKGLKASSVFLAAALITFMPWMVKNYIYTGNPLYPAFYPLLGGKDFSAVRYAWMESSTRKAGFKEAISGLFRHPPELFTGRPTDIANIYGAAPFLGPFVMVFMPLLVLIKKIPLVIKKLAFLSVAMFILWDFTYPIARFLYPAFAIGLVVSAYALSRLVQGSPRYFKAAVIVFVGFFLAFNASRAFLSIDDASSTFGFQNTKENDEDYLRRMEIEHNIALSSYSVDSYINNNLPGDAKVLIIGDVQHLYLNRRHVYTYVSATTPYECFLKGAGDYKAVFDGLKKDGITHILYNPLELRRLEKLGAINLREEDNPIIENALRSPYVRIIATSVKGVDPIPVFLFKIL